MRRLSSAAVVVALLSASLGARADLFIVDAAGGGDFTTIQAAVTHAASGDTILVRAGEYTENVLCQGKTVTVIGQGPAQTILSALSPGPAFELSDVSVYSGSTFRDMRIEHFDHTDVAVSADDGHVGFRSCELVGRVVVIGTLHGSVGLWDCTATDVQAVGGSVSIIENSTVGSASFAGYWESFWGGSYYDAHSIQADCSVVNEASLDGSYLHSSASSFGSVVGVRRSGCNSSGTAFGSIALGAGLVDLQDCTVDGDLTLVGTATDESELAGFVYLERCLIGGDLIVDIEQDPSIESYGGAVRVIHNTILGEASWNYEITGTNFIWPYYIRSNIVLGATHVGAEYGWQPPVISHNDFAGGLMNSAPDDSVYGNIEAPPLFCGAGWHELQDCSPCVGSAHDGAAIGAYGVGCDCATATTRTSWGRVKAMFRQPSN